jgi:hypothetical protein
MEENKGFTAEEERDYADWLDSQILLYREWAEAARARADALDAKEALS